jgi:N-acetylmuramic acid 6-phosphate etherase
LGIAASGVTPYVREGLKEARRKKARTILLTCHSGKIVSPAHHTIAIQTGPEVIAGSTRLKAATATKLVLNSITITTMIQMGKVYGNRMVDLQPRSAKLRARSIRLISLLGKVSEKEAAKLLHLSGGNAKTAILMARKKIDRFRANKLLKAVQGRLHELI